MDLPQRLNGGCACGAVRYQTGVPSAPATLCHCRSCRRTTGAHLVGLFTVAAASVRLTGDPAEYESSPGVTRRFRGRCGTSLTYRHAHWPAELSFTLASLDDPGRVRPTDYSGMADAVSWDVPGDGLQRDGV